LKHGLTAKKITVTPFEKEQDYEFLIEALRKDFQPQTSLEEILIEKMASSLWRLRRIIRAEKAQIQDRLVHSTMEFESKEEETKESIWDQTHYELYPKRTDTLVSFAKLREAKLKFLSETFEERKVLHAAKMLDPWTDPTSLRYESTLERQFYRALFVLLEIRRMRNHSPKLAPRTPHLPRSQGADSIEEKSEE